MRQNNPFFLHDDSNTDEQEYPHGTVLTPHTEALGLLKDTGFECLAHLTPQRPNLARRLSQPNCCSHGLERQTWLCGPQNNRDVFPASSYSGVMIWGSSTKVPTVTYHLHTSLTLSLFTAEGLSATLQLGFLSPELAERGSSSIKQVSGYSRKWDSVSQQPDCKYRQ